MNKYLVCALMLILPLSAKADGPHRLRMVTEAKIQYLYMPESHGIRLEAGLRLETEGGKAITYIIARIRYDAEQWNIGPELRLPVIGAKIEDYRLLLKAELKIPSFIAKE